MLSEFLKHKEDARKVLIKEGKYVVSIIHDKEFYQQRKQTILKKQGKGTKSNATDALTDDQVNFLYENNLHQVLEEATKYLHSDGIKL